MERDPSVVAALRAAAPLGLHSGKAKDARGRARAGAANRHVDHFSCRSGPAAYGTCAADVVAIARLAPAHADVGTCHAYTRENGRRRPDFLGALATLSGERRAVTS